MKRVTFIAIVLLIAGCHKPHYPVIIGKYYVIPSTQLPKGICMYKYTTGPYTYSQEFQDSCSKYNLGDTIKPR